MIPQLEKMAVKKDTTIFIDESGIQQKDGHSIVVLVYVSVEDLESLEKQIKEIEKQLHIRKFHWSDFGSRRGWKIREEFLRRVSGLEFTFRVAVFQNPVYFPEAFEHCLEHLITERKIKKIVIDGKKPKWYERRIKKFLRDRRVSVKKLRTAKDETSPGLRLSDALAGLIRAYYDKPTETVEKLYKLLQNKITAHLVSGQRTR